MNLFKILPIVAHRKIRVWSLNTLNNPTTSDPKTNAYTSPEMCEGGVGFEFGSLDLPIRVYMCLSPHFNHATDIYCDLHVAISGLDWRYADSTQIVEVPYLKHAA